MLERARTEGVESIVLVGVNPTVSDTIFDADEFTVVLRRKDGGLRCPVCGSDDVEDRALAGPTRCRSVAWCGSCRNVVEVMR